MFALQVFWPKIFWKFYQSAGLEIHCFTNCANVVGYVSRKRKNSLLLKFVEWQQKWKQRYWREFAKISEEQEKLQWKITIKGLRCVTSLRLFNPIYVFCELAVRWLCLVWLENKAKYKFGEAIIGTVKQEKCHLS